MKTITLVKSKLKIGDFVCKKDFFTGKEPIDPDSTNFAADEGWVKLTNPTGAWIGKVAYKTPYHCKRIII